MAPTFYHYWPVPVTDKSESMLESQRLGRLGWLCILLILMVVALLVAVITLGIRVNSKACKDGLLAEQECCNATRLLELRLTQTQQDLLETMDQAATCNQTAKRERGLEQRRGNQLWQLLASLQPPDGPGVPAPGPPCSAGLTPPASGACPAAEGGPPLTSTPKLPCSRMFPGTLRVWAGHGAPHSQLIDHHGTPGWLSR
uniref:Bone marrow stromal cell antigen 2 n=1 Tax=Ursus maritimus TaxID=29073 RepID=A0A452U5M5_URSMA